MTDPQADETTPPRKRIAVACGRCRKRKIRCSGDPGGGMPCLNCKNAGVDQCLFLRVQSQEAPMRDENRYDYNMDVSRTLAQRSAGSMAHMSTSMAQYPQDMHILSPSGMPASYRSSGYPNMGAKGYYSMGADWADAYGADGGVDYGLSCPPYQVINNDPVHVVPGYGHWAGARQKSQGSGVYVDSDPGYSYSAGTTAGLVHRPAVSVPGDSSAYSFSSIAASLPSTGNDRLLPNPATASRTLGSSAVGYRADGMPPGYGSSKSSHSSVSGSQTSPTSPATDVAVAVAAAGYASPAYEYGTTGRSSNHHCPSSADAYGSVSTGSSETIFGDSDRSVATQGSAVDLTGYTYGGANQADSLRRASSGSGLTSRSTAESSTSSAGYVGSDGGTSTHSAGYHHSSSSHGHHRRHQHYQGHHASPRHVGSHHLSSQQQHAAVVAGGTAYEEASGSSGGSSSSSSAGGAVGGGVGSTTAATDSYRAPSVSSRR